ncbi:E3 ubiquitin-protein ligase CIP8-like protein [Cinnamomum micranthum f. kanehirae]|uniref:E3 ubiquitin-protein ligase CIP8-like protein n=1 Tax=Cinnamomum micranthum f. kanehirae TaxID=337451 RepID=A0A443PC92_9MAGN|nr:E3 ubiquitin-protein ligase CIP8-like protein [Cinnamomum micranthum f. kanehirae]
MDSNQNWHPIQDCALHAMSLGLIGKWGEDEDLNQAKLSLKLNETETWLARSTDGASIFGVERRELSNPWRDFTTCISDLLLPERLDGFLRHTISQMGLSNHRIADEVRILLSPYVKNKAKKADALGRCFKNLSISVRIELYTNYWFDETIDRALRESQNLNYNMGFGAVPATETAITSALLTKRFIKGGQDSIETCMVCLEEFVEEAEVKQLSCLHFFHGECIVEWLMQSNCCPVCRFRVEGKA